MVNLLLGRVDERMDRNGHSALEVFGLLKDAGERTVRAWVDQLIIQGFLEVSTEGEYPLLSITPTGRALCQDGGTVRLGVPLPPARKSKKGKAAKFVGTASTADSAMFERLRALRRTLAEQLSLPPYVIFHDSVLTEMVARNPRTLREMRSIKGVGDHKLERYGEDFLRVLKQSEILVGDVKVEEVDKIQVSGLKSGVSHEKIKKPYDERMIEIHNVYPRAYEKWNDEEDVRLTQLFQSGQTPKQIAEVFHRQPSAIRSRLRKLNLV